MSHKRFFLINEKSQNDHYDTEPFGEFIDFGEYGVNC